MSDNQKQMFNEWLEETVNSLCLQIDLAESVGENSVSISVGRAKHYLGLCKVLIDLNREAKDG